MRRPTAWERVLWDDPLAPPRDPLLVTLPDPLAKVIHDPDFPGRNAKKLAETIKKYEREKQRKQVADLKRRRERIPF